MSAPIEVSFEVSGPPVPKGRPRFGKCGGVYTPDATRRYAIGVQVAALAACIQQRWPRGQRGDFAVEIDLYMADARLADVDNCAKAILDGANKTVWADDRYVSSLTVRRHIDRERPRAEVRVRRLDIQLEIGGAR
ncbi:MAG TPA: RusA family crossover junction endodeoxyribonuclease [Polyangiaceae bacterium]|jgi:Holliday junction resolvase RusA-like endonuclease|nr:RusA family crossover junction endodeoxyribonuclease [Polyangiaceae bacterium]